MWRIDSSRACKLNVTMQMGEEIGEGLNMLKKH